MDRDTIEPTLFERIGKAEWGATKAQTAADHGASMKKSVEITAEYFEQDGPQQLNGLYIAGTETVICHTGTSPNSPEIAAKLAELWNNQDTRPLPTDARKVLDDCVEAFSALRTAQKELAAHPEDDSTKRFDAKLYAVEIAEAAADKAIAAARAYLGDG